MADYGLKYRAEFKNTREQEYRLDILQRSYTGSSKEIKTLCGCVLEIQGAQGDVTAPIVKTQLRFSVVDAWDIADTSSAKWGNWSEFYTPDATLYKVQLLEKSGNSYTAIWTGYVTPDSWQEDLGYRTAITVTARDNIGHLQDFPFVADGDATPDSNGLIELRYIFSRAMEVIDFPMTFNLETAGSGQYSADVPESENDDYLTEACVNAALFDGMDWYQVLEQTLEAIGYAFRYVGGNTCVIGCLRNLPKMGHYTSATPSQTLEFYGGSLEFEPAVKQIEEKVDFKMQKEVPLEILSGLQYGSATTYRCKVDGNTLPGGGTVSIPEHDAPADALTGAGNTAWVTGYDLFNPASRVPDDFLKRDEGADGWKEYAMLPANYASSAYIRSRFAFPTNTAAVKITVDFTPHPLSIRNSGSDSGKMMAPHYSLSEIKYQVRYSDGSITRYWDGAGWVNDVNSTVTREYDSQNEYGTTLEIELAECDDIASGTIQVCFLNIIYKMFYSGGTGVYARVQSIRVGLASTRAVDSDKVTTINGAEYNVTINRKPLFGALSREVGFAKSSNYLAGLFYYPFVGSRPEQFPYLAHFTDRSGDVPLPVLIHQQILCYRHGAARVLNGNCAPVNKAMFDFGSLFAYKGTTYLLQGGTLDLFSGIMSGAVFHEFVDFNTLWTGTPTYNGSTAYNTDTPGTGYSGGNAGGGGGGGGGSTVSIADLATNGGTIAKITINGTEYEIKNKVEWGSTGSNKAEIYVNNTLKTVLLDGWSELPAVTSSDNGKVLKVVSGHWAKGTVSGGDSMPMLAAPFIEIQKGFTKTAPQVGIYPVLYARHPAYEAIADSEFVLMVYRKRRGRNANKSNRDGCFVRNGWGAAQGKTNHAGFTWMTRTKTLKDIREYILHNYIAIAGEPRPSSMSYSTFQGKTAPAGFSGMYATSAANFKYKTSRKFGLAMRWENPEWTALGLTGTIDDSFTEYLQGNTSIRRWIYTDVAEFTVHVHRASLTGSPSGADGYVIGFELGG